MKIEFEFVHDSNNSKIWIIEKKDKKIIIEYGKKGSKLQKKISSFSTTEKATNEYNKRIKEKLNKGYEKVTKKSSKKSSKKINPAISIETNNKFIDFLKIIVDKVGDEMDRFYQLYKSKKTGEEFPWELYNKNMSLFYNKKYKNIPTQIEKFQNKKILPYLKSGIIVKKINTKIKEDLLNLIDKYSNKINKDYHPGSNNKVLDIVHPSLYPLITNNKPNKNKLDFWNRPYEDSKYQWLPSEFKIDSTGKCTIETYINNLPITEKPLYEQIEKLFELVLPYFEDIWSYSNTFNFYDGDWDLKYKDIGVLKKLNLKNRNLQVITKIVKISLKNNDDLLGAWHVEGMSHENIVATATCTLEQDDKFNTDLYFKRMYSAQEVGDIHDAMCQDMPKEISNLLHTTLVPLGKTKITDGTIVVFPNSHIHKVDMRSSIKTEQTRTIIVFWLINPEITITSTKDVGQQKYSIDKAHKERLKLMEERTYYKQTFNQRDLNLCEH